MPSPSQVSSSHPGGLVHTRQGVALQVNSQVWQTCREFPLATFALSNCLTWVGVNFQSMFGFYDCTSLYSDAINHASKALSAPVIGKVHGQTVAMCTKYVKDYKP